jgi:hypothetical protein
MPRLVMCDPPPVVSCPEIFRIAASNWIDKKNVGDVGLKQPPPAGVRLRWNCPFITGSPRFPDRFIVQRAGPLNRELLRTFNPNVGHPPRVLNPRALWASLNPVRPTVWTAGPQDCASVQAVYIELGPRPQRLTVSLIGTDGQTKVVGTMDAGDRLYYELPDLHAVVFSEQPDIREVAGLTLSAAAATELNLNFATIAELDARAWLTASLPKISERLSSPAGPAYVTISQQDWADLQTRGQALIRAVDGGGRPNQGDSEFVSLNAGHRWETSVLIGWGFLDGEHPSKPSIDKIDQAAMLKAADSNAYAYQVVAEIRDDTGKLIQSRSAPCFVTSEPMQSLKAASCRVTELPRTRFELVNKVDQGPTPDAPVAGGSAGELTFCQSRWEIISNCPPVEQIYTRPKATASTITGEEFDDIGEFAGDGIARPVSFRGLSRVENRDHNFKVPFFDSDVWLEIAAADQWDRRLKPTSTQPLQPGIEYKGLCLPLSTAKCDGTLGTATLTLDTSGSWIADSLARFCGAKISFLLKKPQLTPLEADITIFPASPAGDGSWSAAIVGNITAETLDVFVGGTLIVDEFTAEIKRMGQGARGSLTCTFHAMSRCAGADLYIAPATGRPAKLCEASDSDRLWQAIGAVDVLADGTPRVGSLVDAPLPPLQYSMLLSFATRLSLTFEGAGYQGPITLPVQAPFICPAPKRPDLCVGADELGVDYYGRCILRVTAEHCDRFASGAHVDVGLAAGEISSDSDFAANRSNGIFGSQLPFEGCVFDGFDVLAGLPEGSTFTLGVEYVRPEDSRESAPMLRQFMVRRAGF